MVRRTRRRVRRTDLLEFARPFPLKGAFATYRRGRKWFNRATPGSIVECIGVHGTPGKLRARVVAVFLVHVSAIMGEEGERIRLVYPNVRDDEEFTRLELECLDA